MRNQPKYHFFKNTSYALDGLRDIIKNETSFKIEVIIFFLLLPWIFIIDFNIVEKILLFMTLSGMLLAEVINSAIERTVDLVTLDHHDMAKRAKDAGSSIVFIAIVIFVFCWGILIYDKIC